MDSLGFEKALLRLVWTYLVRKSEGHYFDFEAVALYVQRWDVIHRWSMYDSADAAKRFDELMEAAWGPKLRGRARPGPGRGSGMSEETVNGRDGSVGPRASSWCRTTS